MFFDSNSMTHDMVQGDYIKTTSLDKTINNTTGGIHIDSTNGNTNGGYHDNINNDHKVDGSHNNENNRKRNIDDTVVRNRDVKAKIESDSKKLSFKHQFNDMDEEAEF